MNCKIVPFTTSTDSKSGPVGKIFVSQPSQAEENLLGRVFVVAEIQAKRVDNTVLTDFIYKCLEQNYYASEQLVYLEKAGKATIESIFEEALSRLNKQIADFLISQRINFSPESINITIGAVFDNRIFISNIGANKSFLIYEPKNKNQQLINGYDIIDVIKATADPTQEVFDSAKLFGNTIKGTIPVGASFVIVNEALLEFLEPKQLTKIISSRTPTAASKEIKSIVEKSSLLVPFLALIIKNPRPMEEAIRDFPSTTDVTPGQGYQQGDYRRPLNDTLIQHPLSEAIANRRIEQQQPSKDINRESIKNLNKTEEQTAAILRPTGLLNLETAKKLIKSINWNKLKKSSALVIERQEFVRREAKLSLKKTWGFLKRLASWTVGLTIGAYKIASNKEERVALIEDLKVKKKSLKLTHWVALILIGLSIVIVSINIVWLGKKRESANEVAKYETAKQSIEQKFNDLEAALIYSNNDRAKVLLKELGDDINDIKTTTDERKKYVEDVLTKKQKATDQIFYITRLEKPTNLNGFNEQASSLKVVGKKLVGIYGQTAFIYDIDSNKTLDKTITLPAENCQPTATDNESIFYCYLPNKLVAINLTNQILTETKIDDAPSAEVIGSAIWNGRLYLGTTEKMIYRYTKTGANYASKKSWLSGPADLSNLKALTIDGTIYLLSNNQLVKYRSGNKVDLILETISPELTEASAVATNATADTLVILDKKEKRVIAYTKAGKLKAQYMANNWNDLKAVDISSDGKTVYLLSDGKVWTIKL